MWLPPSTKCVTIVDEPKFRGKLFHTVGPETEKARLPTVLVLTVTADLVVDDLAESLNLPTVTTKMSWRTVIDSILINVASHSFHTLTWNVKITKTMTMDDERGRDDETDSTHYFWVRSAGKIYKFIHPATLTPTTHDVMCVDWCTCSDHRTLIRM